MRKLAATLAVVGALLFSAGSALADFDDDTASANELFVEAVKLVKSVENAEGPIEKAEVLEEALSKLNEIVDDYPSSDLAVKLISGQDTGSISLEDVRERALGARAEAAEEQFNRAFRALTMQLSLSADEDAESLEKKAAALEASLAKMNEIFDEYPSTELAVKLISGQSVGKITLEGVRDAAERAREKADAEADARAKFEMTLKLAEQGLAVAQFNLGRMYTYGSGVPEDYAEAVKWYRMAAEQGHEEAKGWVEYLEAK